MNKEYTADIEITLTDTGIEAENEADFIQKIKAKYLEEHNLVLRDEEITNILEGTNE